MKNDKHAVHYSSKKQDWETPQDLFDRLNKLHEFQLDVCASEANAKCGSFFDEETNGLVQEWYRPGIYTRCWMNPPYGRSIGKWVQKASQESRKGAFVMALLPARTDTTYFHRWIYKQPFVDIEFLKGRLKFSGHKNSAPFPSMLVIFMPK